MSSPGQAPFARLVEYLKRAFQSAAPVNIPADILFAFKNAAQPLEDAGLRDLVKIFDGSHLRYRIRLGSTVLTQIVQIIFCLQPSLLQQKLIYSLLMPPQAKDLDPFQTWRRLVSPKLIPTILRSLQERDLSEPLLIIAAHSLALFVDGDEEAKRVVFNGQGTLRHALGAIVGKHHNYVLKVAVANLIREFMKARPDSRLFWPDNTPAAAFIDFPLANAGDAEWLKKVVEFLSATTTSKAPSDDLPEVYFLQQSDSEPSVAVISDDITLLLPSNAQQPLRFQQLPLIQGLICHTIANPQNEVIIRYRPNTGFQISQGVKRAVEEVHLALGDQSQRTEFANSVQSRVMKKFSGRLPALQVKLPSQRTSHASIDLSQSRETSFESEEESNESENILDMALAIALPSRVETEGAAGRQFKEERNTGGSCRVSQVQITNYVQIPASNPSPEISRNRQSTRKKEAGEESTDHSSAMSSNTVDQVNDGMKDGQRQLKRPSVRSGDNVCRNDIDWDEDLRDDESEPDEPAAKKVKTSAKKAAKGKKAATGKIPLAKSKEVNMQKTSKLKAKPSGKTATNKRTQRTAVVKSAKYVEMSESDFNDDDDDDDDCSSSMVQDSNSLLTKKVLSKKDEIQIDDSQGQEDGGVLNSYELGDSQILPAEGSSSVTPLSKSKGKKAVQDELADDSFRMDTVAKVEALGQNDTSFGTKVAQILTAKANLPVAAMDQPSRKKFGDVKKFVETVNVARNCSPQKSTVKEPQSLLHESHKAAICQTPSSNQISVNSAAQHLMTRVQATKSSTCQPEIRIADHSPGEDNETSDVYMASKQAASKIMPEKDNERATPTSINKNTLKRATGPGNMPNHELALAAPAVTQVKYQEIVITAISTTVADTDEGTQTEYCNIRDELPETELSNPDITASKWSPSKPESQEVLYRIPKGAEAKKSMDPPPPPRQSEPTNAHKPTSMPSDEGDGSFLVADEHVQRKTPIARFGVRGPLNQSVVSPSKQPKRADGSVRAPPETWKYTIAKRQRKAVSLHPIRLLALAAKNDEVVGRGLETINNDDPVLGQEEIASESSIVAQISDANYGDKDVLARGGSAVKKNTGADAASRRNASKSSKVDENGSPRLGRHQKSPTPLENLQVTPKGSEQSETNSFPSDELEYSVNTENSSSPVVVSSVYVPQRVIQAEKSKITQTRDSIGLQDVISEKFPGASKSMNTAAFKRQIEPALSRPTVTGEQRSEVIKKVRGVSSKKVSFHPQAVHVEGAGAPASPSPPNLLSDQSTHVIRLGQKTPIKMLKVVEEASPTPASFNTGFKKILMLPPPLPPPKQGKADLKANPAGKSKRKSVPAIEDEDLTLIEDEKSVDERLVRPTSRHQRQQSTKSSTDSLSSPMPEQMQRRKDSRKPELESSSLGFRVTQQHILSILNRATTGVLFRLQAAEQAIQGKTHEYHLGCYTLIETLETTYEACIQNERSRAAPRVSELCESYKKIIENSSRGLRRVREGPELSSLSEKVETSRNSLLSLIESQIEEADRSEQEPE